MVRKMKTEEVVFKDGGDVYMRNGIFLDAEIHHVSLVEKKHDIVLSKVVDVMFGDQHIVSCESKGLVLPLLATFSPQ